MQEVLEALRLELIWLSSPLPPAQVVVNGGQSWFHRRPHILWDVCRCPRTTRSANHRSVQLSHCHPLVQRRSWQRTHHTLRNRGQALRYAVPRLGYLPSMAHTLPCSRPFPWACFYPPSMKHLYEPTKAKDCLRSQRKGWAVKCAGMRTRFQDPHKKVISGGAHL